MKRQNRSRQLLCLGLALLLLVSLAACQGQAEEQDSTPPTASAAPTETPEPTPTPIPEISEDELHRQFELVYNDCGANVTQSEEQIVKELEALKAIADDSVEIWPDDYEELYQNWRANTVAKWMNGLKMSYWQIIERRPGLIYANYIDPEQSGTPKLMLLSWSGQMGDYGYDHIITLELYGEENGQAAEWWKQDITFSFSFNESASVSLAIRDGQLFLSTYFSDSRGSFYFASYDFYALNRESGGAADKFSYYYDKTDDSESYSHGGSGIGSGEYQTQLDAYQTLEKIADLSMIEINGTVDGNRAVHTWGILDVKNEVHATVEVDGVQLRLSRNPYAYGDPYASDSVLMVPIRDTLEAMGVAVYVGEYWSTVLAATKNDTLVIENTNYYGDANVFVAESAYSMNGGTSTKTTVEWSEEELYAPLQAFVPLFGAQVEWDLEAAAIKINGTVPESERMSAAEVEELYTTIKK